ncbi:hypothetical protein F0U60_15005 [Archangium minus]|uniref:Uncharacterized protein n=1 Tax=Archangium minus TaxID=83450 RepID=A0ABY9WN88_9BACT|nr:hypothetical protein F0U60_15005 [Archangium minus]
MSDLEAEFARVEAEIARDRAALLDRLIRNALQELRPPPREAVTGNSVPHAGLSPGPVDFITTVMQLRDMMASGGISRDFGGALLSFVISRATPPERFRARDLLLVEAAEAAGGTTWAKMLRIHAELSAQRNGRQPDATNRVGLLVHEAISFGPNGRLPGRRQLLRILSRQP